MISRYRHGDSRETLWKDEPRRPVSGRHRVENHTIMVLWHAALITIRSPSGHRCIRYVSPPPKIFDRLRNFGELPTRGARRSQVSLFRTTTSHRRRSVFSAEQGVHRAARSFSITGASCGSRSVVHCEWRSYCHEETTDLRLVCDGALFRSTAGVGAVHGRAQL